MYPIFLMANPGAFVRDAPNLPVLVIGAVVFIVGAVIPLIAGDVHYKRNPGASRQYLPSWSTDIAFPVVFLGMGLILASVIMSSSGSGAHRDQVVDWLQTDYNIDVDAGIAERLLDGENIVVEIAGERTIITILDGADGDLDVIDQVGDVIAPRR